MILKTLGFTEEEIEEANRKDKERADAEHELYLKWSDWLKKFDPFIRAYNCLDSLLPIVTMTNNENVIVIKATKKNLNEIIKFSSSRYNDYKKPDFVNLCYNYIQNAKQNEAFKETGEAITGCFSAGAHGQGGKMGGSRFNAKFLNSGKYKFVMPFGMPILILDDSKYVLFEGFEYHDIERNKEIIEKYEEYQLELSKIPKLPF